MVTFYVGQDRLKITRGALDLHEADLAKVSNNLFTAILSGDQTDLLYGRLSDTRNTVEAVRSELLSARQQADKQTRPKSFGNTITKVENLLTKLVIDLKPLFSGR